ncbi:MAG: 23S rRNA (uracil(1939)-C(5))-methyltransferase RlmD [Bacillota bacterium]|nr:23S rRNA (uracil(1939)-C(5))-methyltransferase RlmD [Bacillota bacterium]
MTINKNQIVELEITGMSHDGTGIGRFNGLAVFVPLSAIGDVIKVKILKVEKNRAFGKIESLISPSKDRIDSICPVFNKCGGCVYHHISYEAELKLKWQRVKDSINRIGGIGIIPDDIIPAENTESYRNKAEYPVSADKNGNIITGFYAPHTHSIISFDRCYIQNPIADSVRKIVQGFMDTYKISAYDEKTGNGLVRHIFVRTGTVSGEVMVMLVINGRALPYSDKLISLLCKEVDGIVSICINVNKKSTNVILGEKFITLYGKDAISDVLCGLKFNISAPAFYQVNHDQCEKLYSKALDFAGVSKNDICVDLFCGIGTITLLLAKYAKYVYGIEIVPEAIEDAKNNARLNNINNVEFICESAENAAFKLKEKGVMPDVLTVDPPRKGLTPPLIDTIVDMKPHRIVYVSCDPATLARDLAVFSEKGYKTVSVAPVDMFPRTSHVETVVLMSRVKE